MVKCFKIDLVPAGMNTQALAVTSFIIAHDTRMDGFLKMDDPTFAEERRLGGAYAEWLMVTDAMLANAILGSFERSSTHVQNLISEFGQDAGLVSSGRALLKHFMRLYNAELGFEEYQYQAEEVLKAFAPFTVGADEADSKKHGYGLVECYGRLLTTRLLLQRRRSGAGGDCSTEATARTAAKGVLSKPNQYCITRLYWYCSRALGRPGRGPQYYLPDSSQRPEVHGDWR